MRATGDLRQSVNEAGTEFAKEVKENYVAASAAWITQNQSRFPALNRTKTSAGLPQPLADVDSAREYGRMLASPKEHAPRRASRHTGQAIPQAHRDAYDAASGEYFNAEEEVVTGLEQVYKSIADAYTQESIAEPAEPQPTDRP